MNAAITKQTYWKAEREQDQELRTLMLQWRRSKQNAKFPRVWEPDENITDENTYQLALAKRNMKISGLLQESMSINEEKLRRSPRRVRFA